MHILLATERHAPPGRFRFAMRREFSKRQGADLFALADLTLPAGAQRIASRPLSVVGVGPYEGLAVGSGFGPVTYVISERAYSLASLSTTIEVADRGAWFTKAIARYGHRLKGSAARCRIGAGSAYPDDWFQYFTGVLDSWDRSAPNVWRLSLMTPEVALRGYFPKVPLTRGDWPNLHTTTEGSYAPLLVGVHDSTALTNKGMVPLPYVDTVNRWYLVSLGLVKRVRRAFSAGTEKTEGADWTQLGVTINGRFFSVVIFTADQGTNAITADVEGITDSGTGGLNGSTVGTLVTDPLKAFEIVTTNFILGDWKSGPWLDPVTAGLEMRFVGQTGKFLRDRGHEYSRRLGGRNQTRGLDYIEGFAGDHHLHPFWTGDGKIAVRPLDPTEDRWGESHPWVRGRREDFNGFALAWNTKQVSNRVSTQYLYGEVDGRFFGTVDVEDRTINEPAILNQSMQSGASRLV